MSVKTEALLEKIDQKLDELIKLASDQFDWQQEQTGLVKDIKESLAKLKKS